MLSSATPATASDSSHPYKHRARHRDAERDKRPKDRDPSPRVPSDYIAIKHQLGKGHNATVYLVDWNTDPVPRAMKKIPRNNKRTENMNRLRANNPARSAHGGGAPLPRTADPTALVDRRGTEEAKIRKEIAIMKKCDHPNIIKFFSFIDDQMSANICLILEYMEGGELQWQADGAPYLTMDQTRRCTRDVVLGLQYLHLQGIIHRDIKPSNIMWTADRSHVKIGDFGVAHLVTPAPGDDLDDTAESSLRHAGTPAFLAPEIAPGAPVPHLSSSDDLNADNVVPYASVVSPAVDLWALGVTLYCMLFGRRPFNPSPEAADSGSVAAEASLYRAIREDEWTLPGGRGRGTWVPPSCGSECMCSTRVRVEKADWSENGVLGLLAGLLIKDPRERWGIEQVKDVAWLLHDIQRRQEWIQGTTPQIVVSAADEANAILEPKYKWNLKAAVSTRMRLGRRFSNFFRARERDEEGGTGYVRSEPNVDVRESRRAKDEKGKGRTKPDSGKTGAMKDGKTKKSRSVDARSQRLEGSNLEKPRRGSESVTTLPPPLSGESPTTRRTRGLFRWGGGRESPSLHPPSSSTTSSTAASSSTFHAPPSAMTTTRVTAPPRRLGVFGRARHPFSAAARHSTEALGSASMVPPPFFGGGGAGLGAEQRTASMADARITTNGLGLGGGGGGGTGAATDSDGDGDGAGAGIGKGMIAAPRATVVSYHAAYDAQRKEEEVGDEGSIGSGSGCSYGSGARSRDGWRDLDVDDGDPYTDDYDDDDDDRPRADVYDSTSSGDEENVPITFKGARQRAELTTSPPNGHEGAGTNANGGASLDTDVDSTATEADAPPPPDSDPEDNEDDKRQASLTIPNGPGL